MNNPPTLSGLIVASGRRQRDIAAAAGISETYLAGLKLGRRRNPGLATIGRLAAALSVSEADVVAALSGTPESAIRSRARAM